MKVDCKSYRLPFIVSLAAAMVLSGCTTKAPDAPLETNVSNLQVSATQFGSLGLGSHVAGMIQISVPDSLQTFPIGRVALFLDSTNIGQSSDPPYAINLDTRMYSQGGHILTLAVYEKHPTMGLLNLVGAPRLECVDTLFFDQTPPPGITGVSISGTDTITVRWDPSTALNFRKYIVWVSFLQDYYGTGLPYKDTLYDRSTPELRIASPFGGIVGAGVQAQVAQSNGPTMGPVTWGTSAVGTQLPVGEPVINFWEDRNLNESYAFTGDGHLYALSSDGKTVLRSGMLTSGQSAMFSPNGQQCFVFSPSKLMVTSYSTQDFSKISSFKIDSAAETFSSAILGSNGRIYVSNYQGIVWTYDSNTGQLLNSFQLPDAPWINPVTAISGDGNTLFIAEKSWMICKVNVGADPPSVEDSVALSQQASIDYMGITQDQKYLVVAQFWSNSIKLFDSSDMSLAATLQLPDEACGLPTDGSLHSVPVFALDGEELIAASTTPVIVQFNLLTHNIDGTWCVVNAPKSIGVSPDGHHILIGGIGNQISNFILDR